MVKDKMNLDLIIKLVKLANNNPNEHEANSAARQVCKLIAAGEFKFNNTNNDIKDKSIHPSQASSNYKGDPYMDIINQYRAYTKSYNPYYDLNYKPFTDEKKPKPKKTLICRSCGLSFETGFVGPESMYECHTCQWKFYKETK